MHRRGQLVPIILIEQSRCLWAWYSIRPVTLRRRLSTALPYLSRQGAIMAYKVLSVVDRDHSLVDWTDYVKKRCAGWSAGRISAHSGTAVRPVMFNEVQCYLTECGMLRRTVSRHYVWKNHRHCEAAETDVIASPKGAAISRHHRIASICTTAPWQRLPRRCAPRN